MNTGSQTELFEYRSNAKEKKISNPNQTRFSLFLVCFIFLNFKKKISPNSTKEDKNTHTNRTEEKRKREKKVSG